MPECLDVVGLRWSPGADIDGDVLRSGFQTIQRIPQMLPGASLDQDLVGSQITPFGFTARLVGSLPVRRSAVPLRTARPPRGLEPSPTPRTVPNVFCHSDTMLMSRSTPTKDHTSRRPINARLDGIQANVRTTVTNNDRQ